MEIITSPAEKIYVNGISALTGEYLVPPIDFEDIQSILKTEQASNSSYKNEVSFLTRIWKAITQSHLGLPPDIKPEEVAQAGWGIVFDENEDPAIKDALDPFIEHRRQQVPNKLVKVFDYRHGESCARWLARYGVGRGAITPSKVPYYLLLIGGPDRIPFSFCHELDVEYAVGVLDFDTPDEYRSYIDSVISYETAGSVSNAKEAIFFGTRHLGDRATILSADSLVAPLADGDRASREEDDQGVAAKWGFQSRKFVGQEATKAKLAEILSSADGSRPPAFLFTATHGLGFPKGHQDQQENQGALLCQDWRGLGAVAPTDYFAAADIPENSSLTGSVIFSFACFGAGTPSHDRFVHRDGKQPPAIADGAFVAALPKKLLSQPAGGALAFIGHVERAWGCSIVTPGAGTQLQPFQNSIGRILKGEPIGHALKDFNEKYAAVSTSLSGLLEQISNGMAVSKADLAGMWVERNDAEGYLLLGDPAVRLRVNDLL